MWEFILYIFPHFLITVLSQGGFNTQGEGVYTTISVDECGSEIEDPIMTFEVEKHKINHTHEVFNAKIGATMDIDDSFGLFIEVCKLVDGGCKHYATIVEGMEKLLKKHAKNNLENAFRCAGLDQKEFPIPKGNHEVKDFIMDYCELPTYAPFGTFEAEAYVIKDERRVGCIKAVLEFKEDDLCS
ncbi:uncharacterized protein LOC123876512 [Maniola jurtina]|uniref:uncharacterized protein LOC123876512 n=1 Tax=Maniola jurtina TaxID=191418 RepID=UPI001E68DD57|nr:uncharacterized protein LOC123876512 [Maniola jurtina]